jgi:hypothetical protein
MGVAVEFVDNLFSFSINDIDSVRSVTENSFVVHTYFLYVRTLQEENE